MTMVPETGIEPVRPISGKRRILSPLCLPISPLGPAQKPAHKPIVEFSRHGPAWQPGGLTKRDNSATITRIRTHASLVVKPTSCLVLLLLGSLLTGCASQTAITANALDQEHPEYRSASCRQARAEAWVHQDIKYARLVGSPVVLWVGGPITAVPLLVANVGLGLADKRDASALSAVCGGQASGDLAIAASTATEAVLGVAASSAGSLATKVVPLK